MPATSADGAGGRADQVEFGRVGARLFVGGPGRAAALRTAEHRPAVGNVAERVAQGAHRVDDVAARRAVVGVGVDTGRAQALVVGEGDGETEVDEALHEHHVAEEIRRQRRRARVVDAGRAVGQRDHRPAAVGRLAPWVNTDPDTTVGASVSPEAWIGRPPGRPANPCPPPSWSAPASSWR